MVQHPVEQRSQTVVRSRQVVAYELCLPAVALQRRDGQAGHLRRDRLTMVAADEVEAHVQAH